jgi:hypothetical protein
MDIREKCKLRAVKFASEWGYNDVSNHILDIMVSIMCTRDKSSYSGGGFVTAICNNDLIGAVSRADSECENYLKLFALTNDSCYVEQLEYI